MQRFPYDQIDKGVIPPRMSVLGYVKVGGLQDKVLYTRDGRPWVPPTRYVAPVRFEVTTREQRIEEIQGRGKSEGQKFKVNRGYVRDEKIHAVVGEAPSELEVRFMFPKWHQNFVCHFGAHSGKKWVCQGNGVEALDIVRGTVPCPCPRLAQFEGTYEGPQPSEMAVKGRGLVPCKPRGVLSMIIPAAETFGGFHVFKTTSWESIANLRTQLEAFEAQFGRVDGLPFQLRVYPATKSYGDGEGTTTQPIVTLVIPASFDTARQLAAAAAEESRRYLLAAGGSPDPDRHQEVLVEEMRREAESEGQEFFPEEEGAGPTMEERIRAKAEKAPATRASSPAPQTPPQPPTAAVVEDDTQDPEDGPYHEIVGEEEPEAEEAPAGAPEAPAEEPGWIPPPCADSARGELKEQLQAYHAILAEKVPGGCPEASLRAWQAEKVGKDDTETWDPEDFQLAILLVKRGDAPPAEVGDGEVQGELLEAR